MYPLYRSWLGAGPPHDPGALQTPPDTIIVVGDSSSSSRQFAGHRAVLTAHSGFFKGALSGRTASPTSICVPSVFPEAFGPLLSFMYTGYLAISPDNIYGVLLATQYLHMPRALDLCCSYLRQNQLLPATVRFKFSLRVLQVNRFIATLAKFSFEDEQDTTKLWNIFPRFIRNFTLRQSVQIAFKSLLK